MSLNRMKMRYVVALALGICLLTLFWLTPYYTRYCRQGEHLAHESFIYCGLCSKWSALPCNICKVGVNRMHLFVKQNEDEISILLTKLCIILKIKDEQVCTGIVKVFKSEVLTVAEEVILTSNQTCGYIFGDSCAKVYNPFMMWNISLPPVSKPPVTLHVPPKAGSPTMRILHITDIHLDFLYQNGTNAECTEPICCHDGDAAVKGTPAGRWGDYRSCDIPTWTVENLFQHLAQNEQFDMIYWTGDLTGHNIWSQTRSKQLKAMKYIKSMFEKYLSDVPMFPSLGNHDGCPVNSFPPPYIKGNNSMDWLYNALLTNWSSWLPNDTFPTISKGGYYTVLFKPGFRIISLNTNYCSSRNWWIFINVIDPAGELAWLISVLQHAEDLQEKVHILGHIPPGSGDCTKAWSWNYYSIVNRYESTITGQFFGHTHYDHMEIFYDPETDYVRPVSVAFIAPSVTAFYNLNPGFRIYTMDGYYFNSSWCVLDHETYIMNLTEANLFGQPKWRKEYTLKEEYNLENAFPADLDSLVTTFQNRDELFQHYYRHFYKGHPPGARCEGGCMASMLCGIRTAHTHDSNLCANIHK